MQYALIIYLLLSVLSTSEATAESPENSNTEITPKISIADDMSEIMLAEASQVKEKLKIQAKTLFQRDSLGFSFTTIGKVKNATLELPLRIPRLFIHITEQARILGLAGSLLILFFIIMSLLTVIGRKRVLERLKFVTEDWEIMLDTEIQRYVIAIRKIIASSIIPLGLFVIFKLVQALIAYNAGWFIFLGRLFQLWVIGSFGLSFLNECLANRVIPFPETHSNTLFRVARIILWYVLFSIAVFWAAEAFALSSEYLALLRFVISLTIVFAIGFLIFKKKAIIGIIPDLPYRSFQIFKALLTQFFVPVMTVTYTGGLLWCFGYKKLCGFVWVKTWGVIFTLLLSLLIFHKVSSLIKEWYSKKEKKDEAAQYLHRALNNALLYATTTITSILLLYFLGALNPIQRIISFPILVIGQSVITLWILLKASLILTCFILLSRLLRAYLDYTVYPKLGLEEGLAYSVNTLLGYMLTIVGFFFALKTVGLDLRVLLIFAGAIGIGIGFGLQNIAANLISGLILIFGRKVRKGDWIQIGNTLGYVKEVNLRATKIKTRDNIEYVVPNSDLTSGTVINYTLSDPEIRIHIPVGVSYSAKPELVSKILSESARQCTWTSQVHEPEVWFTDYGDSAILFKLLVWIDIRKVSEEQVKSDLYFRVFEALDREGIEIPFPQRDVYIKSPDTKS